LNALAKSGIMGRELKIPILRMLPVVVRDNNVDKALKTLKRMSQKSGLNKELRKRRAFMKPSEKRQKKAAEASRRVRKALRKRVLREGY
jgi:small subunit ribosomal protein S21